MPDRLSGTSEAGADFQDNRRSVRSGSKTQVVNSSSFFWPPTLWWNPDKEASLDIKLCLEHLGVLCHCPEPEPANGGNRQLRPGVVEVPRFRGLCPTRTRYRLRAPAPSTTPRPRNREQHHSCDRKRHRSVLH